MISIKSTGEIASMRQGGEILHTILIELEKNALPGVTTKELDELAENLVKKHSVKASFKGYRGFPATICASINEEVVHGIPSDRKLNEGDILSLDMGVFYQGLHTDSALTVLIGVKSSNNAPFFIKTVKKALYKALKVVKAGNTIGDIGFTIQKTIERVGFNCVRDCIGHGVGKNLHEEPDIPNYGKKGTGPVLKSGMTLAIEPIATMGAYETEIMKNGWTVVSKDKSMSAHFEHTVLVTEDGYEIFT